MSKLDEAKKNGVHNFNGGHDDGWELCLSGPYAFVVYNSVESLLACRASGREICTARWPGVGAVALLSKENFDNGTLTCRLEERDRNSMDMAGNQDMYNFKCDSEKRFGFIACKTPQEKGTNAIVGHLTYDGLCAYLAFASNVELVENRDTIAKEILRCASYEMLKVDDRQPDCAQEFGKIGDRYSNLQHVAKDILNEAVERYAVEKQEEFEHPFSISQEHSEEHFGVEAFVEYMVNMQKLENFSFDEPNEEVQE